MNIILIGFKSCGKSTIGQALAEYLTMSFIDTDTLLEERHAKSKGEHLSFREIYKQYGKLYFRTLEKQITDHLGQIDKYVIAAGGGTFINYPITPQIQQNSKLFYLEASPTVLIPRIKTGGLPAFFRTDDFEQEFNRLFNQREPIYESIADYTIEISNLDIQNVVHRVIKYLEM